MLKVLLFSLCSYSYVFGFGFFPPGLERSVGPVGEVFDSEDLSTCPDLTGGWAGKCVVNVNGEEKVKEHSLFIYLYVCTAINISTNGEDYFYNINDYLHETLSTNFTSKSEHTTISWDQNREKIYFDFHEVYAEAPLLVRSSGNAVLGLKNEGALLLDLKFKRKVFEKPGAIKEVDISASCSYSRTN